MTLKGHKKFGQKQSWFPNQPKKIGKLVCSRWGVYFLGSDLETTIQFLAKLLIALQCHKMKLLGKCFCQAIYFLDKTNQWNLKNWPFLLAAKKFTNLFWADLEIMIQFLLELFMALQCHKMKLLWKFLFQAICLLDKMTNKIWKFDPSCLLQRNSPIWFGVIWKPRFSFCPNFLWPFSVTTCESFWFKQFTFYIKQTNKIWIF